MLIFRYKALFGLLFAMILNCETAYKSRGIFDRWGSRVRASAAEVGWAIRAYRSHVELSIVRWMALKWLDRSLFRINSSQFFRIYGTCHHAIKFFMGQLKLPSHCTEQRTAIFLHTVAHKGMDIHLRSTFVDIYFVFRTVPTSKTFAA